MSETGNARLPIAGSPARFGDAGDIHCTGLGHPSPSFPCGRLVLPDRHPGPESLRSGVYERLTCNGTNLYRYQ